MRFIVPAHSCLALLALLLTACSQQPLKEAKAPVPCNCPPAAVTQPAAPAPVLPPPSSQTEPIQSFSLLRSASWNDLHGFSGDDLSAAWGAWQQSCRTLINRPPWQKVCAAAALVNPTDQQAMEDYFRQHFTVYQASNADGSTTGLITGYYQPMLYGSRVKTERYRYPLYSRPDDLVTVELANLYPELANKRIRGRLAGQKLVPYYSREQIEADPSPLQGRELVWVDDNIDLFFLQIQGSGIIQFENGERIQVGYADQNGYTYRSIGRVLIDRGEISAEQASMEGIKQWAREHPQKLDELLNSNPSYVFFRQLPAGLPGPLGALGVPVTAARSLAIDPRYIPLGAPVFLATTYPNSNTPLNQLMLAQDTGGAIKGGVRADFYWGAGDEAGMRAGAMKQRGKIWVLLPKDFPLPSK